MQEEKCLGFDLIDSQSLDFEEHAIVQAMIDRWQRVIDVKVVQETYDHFGFDTSGFSKCVPFLDSLAFIEFDCNGQGSGHWQSSLLDAQMVPRAEVKCIFTDADGWPLFESRYGDPKYLEVARPCISASGNVAHLLYLDSMCTQILAFLRKGDGEWMFVCDVIQSSC